LYSEAKEHGSNLLKIKKKERKRKQKKKERKKEREIEKNKRKQNYIDCEVLYCTKNPCGEKG
jgi:hypothetical protein